jgi:hypothetical protein
MSDHQQGPGWWLASDGKWYPPQGAPPVPPPHTWAPGPPPGPPPKQGMSAGAIVALVIGSVVGGLLLLGVAVSVLGTESDGSSSQTGSAIGDSDGTNVFEADVDDAEIVIPDGYELVEGDGVAMAIPEGWEVIDAADAALSPEEFAEAFPDAPPGMVEQGLNVFEQGAVLVAFERGGGEFASNVNVIKIPGEAPLDVIEDQAVQQLRALGGEVTDSYLAGHPLGDALRIEYTLDVTAPDGSLVTAQGVQQYLPHDGSTYVITLTTGDDAAPEVPAVVIVTFRVT